MSAFTDAVRGALKERGLSQRAAAEAMHYNSAYLSRVLAGKQRPSADFVAALDAFLGLDLCALLAEPQDTDRDNFVQNAVGYLLEHDNRHGGDHVADAAVQVWRAERAKLRGDDKHRLAQVAELAEVAGWILFDAARFQEARSTLTEAHMMARLSGDAPLEWFILDLIAMVDVHTEQSGEALAITEEMLSRPGVPHRVALMSRVRRARSLAQTGDRARTLEALERASGALQDSVQGADPAYTWWIDQAEVDGHKGEALLSLGDPKGALPYLRECAAVSRGGGRREFGNVLAELHAYALLGRLAGG